MKINLRHIPPEGKRYTGDEDIADLKLDAELYRFEEPVHYELEATLTGGGLLVRGTLQTRVRATCVRTVESFYLPVFIEEFSVHLPDEQGDIVDLTPHIREDILLALPAHPVSPEASKAVPLAGQEPPTQRSAAWDMLEKIKGKLRAKKP